MNATKEKVFVLFVGTKKANEKKANKKRREKELEPLFALFCRPIDFKKTNFTILILLILVYSQTLTHTYIIYRF